MKKFIYAAILFLAAFSCRRADLEADPIFVINPNPVPRRVEFVTFKAKLSEAEYQSKASLDLDVTRKTTWEKGDKVLLTDGVKSAVYTAVSGGRDTTTLVRESGDTLVAGVKYQAYYPATLVSEGLPGSIEYNVNPKGVPMVGSGISTIEFKNLCGAVRCAYMPNSTIVVKKLLISAKEGLSGKGDIVVEPIPSMKINGTQGLNYSFTEFSPLGYRFYSTMDNQFTIFLPEGNYTDFNVQFISDDQILADVTLEYVMEVKRSAILDLDLNSPEGDIINLSKRGTANCYCLSKAGDYYFKPTKGCSTDEISGIADVRVIWEMDNTSVPPTSSIISNPVYSDGAIRFSVVDPYTPRNILLGAYDSGNKLLWSWHLWAGSTTPAAQPYSSDGKVSLLDRSLGSLNSSGSTSDASVTSLLYQWGRKDPIPGRTSQRVDGDRVLIKCMGRNPENVAGPVSIETSIQNPVDFYTSETKWSEEVTAGTWSSTEKTIYDPCPPGYLVSPLSAFSASSDDFFYAFHTAGKPAGYWAFYRNGDNKDIKYVFTLTSFFDGAAGRQQTPATGSSSAVLIWTSDTVPDDANQSYMVRMTSTPEMVPDTGVPPETKTKACALSVRCMKMTDNQ